MKKNLPDYDIAIVGGGAGGVYTAWRMLLEGPDHSPRIKKWKKERGGKLKIVVFEGSERIGGRVLSAKAPGLPDIVCEIGGMRFVSSQSLVSSLVLNKFKLPTKQQAVDEPCNILYLRGKRLNTSDLNDANKLPYNLTIEEIKWLKGPPKNTADNFLAYAVYKAIPEIAPTKKNKSGLSGNKLRKFLNKKKINGVPLYKIGFWNLIASHLSHEAYSIAVTTVGYDCLGYNTNAVDAICEYFDFTPAEKYYLLKNGYDSLIWTMQEEFEKAGGEVITGKWLESFDGTSLPDQKKGVELKFRGDGKVLTSREIVLAMPRRSLQLLAQKGPVLDPVKAPKVRFMMDSVEPIHLYKMFIAYDHPWWERRRVTEGRSITDIPIRQCYYWGKEEGPLNTNAIMMVYNDALSSDFWGGLRQSPLGPGDSKTDFSEEKFKRKIMPFVKSMTKKNQWDKRLLHNWEICEAPKVMVEEMHRQLKLMHDVPDAPEPLEAAFADWGDDPYGGAVHFWNPGYDSSKILHDMIQPVKNFPCYICGEAYSTNQTWVEGALQTAELVLRKFDIPDPEWFSK